MSDPHRIRLRGPWVVRTEGACVVRSRRFGLPTGLTASMRVWLTFAGVAGSAALNGRHLGSWTAESAEYDVTDWLAERNVVELTAGGAGEVALEIRHSSAASSP